MDTAPGRKVEGDSFQTASAVDLPAEIGSLPSPAFRPGAGPITIRLDLPAPQLSPNARTHWAVKAKYVAAYRAQAWAAAYQLKQRRPDIAWPLPKGTRALVCAVVRQNRRRDRDNFTASLKSAWDGFVSAGLLKDDSADWLKVDSPEFVVITGKRAGFVLIRLNPPIPRNAHRLTTILKDR